MQDVDNIYFMLFMFSCCAIYYHENGKLRFHLKVTMLSRFLLNIEVIMKENSVEKNEVNIIDNEWKKYYKAN